MASSGEQRGEVSVEMHWTRQAQQVRGCFWEAMDNPLPPAQASGDSRAGEEGTWDRAQAVTGIASELEQSEKGRLSWEMLVAEGGSCSSARTLNTKRS